MITAPALLVLGNANVDLVLGEVDGWPAIGTEVVVERSETRPGGSAGNTALALSGMGVAHRFIASTGSDANGAWLRSRFDQASCDWIVDQCDTTVTVGIVHRGGDRVFFTTPGHLQRATLDDLLDRLPDAPHALACAILSGGFLMPEIDAGTARLLSALKQKGWTTAIDPGWPPAGWTDKITARMKQWLALTDFALLNADEVKGYASSTDLDRAIAAIAAEMSPRQALVVKDGAAGASVIRDGRRLHAASPKVEVIDTVGAGDTFNAAFLAATVSGVSLGDALKAGVETAARAISTFPRRYDVAGRPARRAGCCSA